MWWVRKGAWTQGPFGEDEMRRRILTNQIGSLDRVSCDQRTWCYVKDTPFWRTQTTPASTSPSPVEVRMKRRQAAVRQKEPVLRRTMRQDVNSLTVQTPRRARHETSRFHAREWGWCLGGGLVIAILCVVVFIVARSVQRSSNVIREKVLLVNCMEGNGTGFLLNMDGKTYLVSNEHVLRSAGFPKARFVDGRELRLGAFSVATDRDLARFEVIGSPAKPLELESDMPNVDDKISVCGNSLGNNVITILKGDVKGVGPKEIEIDAGIVHGNSGSPVLNEKGRVIGVATRGKPPESAKENWALKDTRFDGAVQRFASRLAGVEWQEVERETYQRQAGKLNCFEIYLGLLRPYLYYEDSLEKGERLPRHSSEVSKLFTSATQAFDEILKLLDATYWEIITLTGKIAPDEIRRKFIEQVNADTNLTSERKEELIREYTQKQNVQVEKLANCMRDMALKRRAALVLCRNFILNEHWCVRQLRYGSGCDGGMGSLEWYLPLIDFEINRMNELLSGMNNQQNDDK